MKTYNITQLKTAKDIVLLSNVYLVLLYANRTPPHLLISISGKTFTLNNKGASVDGELAALLTLIRKKNIAAIFLKLKLPAIFTMPQLQDQIRACTLAYPRADASIATCLAPINDFCHSIYHTEKQNVNLIFDLLPALKEKNIIEESYQLNMDHLVHYTGTYSLQVYQMSDVAAAIHNSLIQTV